MKNPATWLVPIVCLAVASACAHTSRGGGIGISGPVRFQTLDGREAFRIEPTGGGIRVENGAGEALVGLRLLEGALAIEGPRGRLVALVLPPSQERRGYHIVSADQHEKFYSLRTEPDGDLIVFDTDAARLYEAKRRAYGFKVIDRNGRVESKIRVRAEKISMRDPSGVTFLTTRDPFPAFSAAALSFEDLPFEYAVGLSIALAHWAPAVE